MKQVWRPSADDLSVFEPWDIKTRKRSQRQRKTTLASAIAQARKAGLTPTAAAVKADGSVMVEFGNGTSAITNDDSLDSWIQKHARQTKGH